MPAKQVRYRGELLHHNAMAWPQPADAPPLLADAVLRAMQSLKPLHREIILRRFWQGQDLRTIAYALDLPPHEIRNCLRRALRRLRDALGANSHIPKNHSHCRICRHPKRLEIDRMLSLRDCRGTWRGYMVALRVQFGITGLPPKAVLAHMRHHQGGVTCGDI